MLFSAVVPIATGASMMATTSLAPSFSRRVWSNRREINRNCDDCRVLS